MFSRQTSNFDDPFSTDKFQFYKGRSRSEYGPGFQQGFISRGSRFIPNGYGAKQRQTKKTKQTSTQDGSESEASYDSAGKQKSFHRVWVRFAEKTSMQGIPYIHNAKLLWAKIVWVIMTLIAIAAMVAHLYYLIAQFYGWPMITKISLGFDSLRLPDVTICNTNIMKQSELQIMQDADDLKQLIAYMNPSNLAPDIRKTDGGSIGSNAGGGVSNTGSKAESGVNNAGNTVNGAGENHGDSQVLRRRKRFIDEHRDFNFSGYGYENPKAGATPNNDEFDGEIDHTMEINNLFTALYMDLKKHERAQLGHNISDMLISCTFDGRTCESGLFRLHQTSEYGNCWILRSPKFVSKTSGPGAGLQLVLYMESTEYIPGVSNGYGARLTVSEPGTHPYPSDEGLDISSSMETSIGLKMVRIARLGTPYSDGCEDGVAFKEKYQTKYSRKACQTVCQVDALMDRCGCFEKGAEEIVMIKNSTAHPCRTQREVNCLYNVTKRYENQEVSCNCLNPCVEIQYEKSWSQRQWPSDYYAVVLLREACEKTPSVCDTMKGHDARALNYNFLKLNIYYEDLNYEVIEEDPEIETTQFLSDVGGATGLWIGLSVLAFCEIFQLIAELIDYGIHRVRKNQTREKRKEKERRRRRREKSRAPGSGGGEKFKQWPQTEFDSYIKMNKGFSNEKGHLRDGNFIDIPRDY